MTPATLQKRLLLAAFLLCALVVVVGAYVRLTDAGLGCPDWPGCYGHITPAGAVANDAAGQFGAQEIEVGKAWREMIHRYSASVLGLLIVVIAALALHMKRDSPIPLSAALGLLALVVVQGMLGMLTVTWQLKPLVVTLHLLFGMLTLALLWWQVLSLWRRSSNGWRSSTPFSPQRLASARRAVLIALALLALQLALGGWTSSNYAATACPDLPRCQNAWLPPAEYGEAFVLWRGLGVNYEGGVLASEARVAIHFSHRVGAVIVTLWLLYLAIIVLRRHVGDAFTQRAAIYLLSALALQLAVGIGMVWRGFPLWLATAHNAGGALLLLGLVALMRALYPPHR